jgi:tRNA(Ile)-lysidine synthase
LPGSEESLRGERYAFLTRAANQAGARYVATAHTADDQVETVLFNVLRGTGLAGLAGIPRCRKLTESATLIRPLLDVNRGEVLAYLRGLKQSFREDSSNASPDYTRNRIRHELLPYLETNYNPRVRGAILRLATIARSAEESKREAARLQLETNSQLVGGSVQIQKELLRRSSDSASQAVLREAWRQQGWPLAEMTHERWEELLAFALHANDSCGAQVAPRMFPGGIRAEGDGQLLRLTQQVVS